MQVREHPGDGGRGARPHHHGGARTDRSACGESPLSSSYLRGLLDVEFSIGPLGPLRECRCCRPCSSSPCCSPTAISEDTGSLLLVSWIVCLCLLFSSPFSLHITFCKNSYSNCFDFFAHCAGSCILCRCLLSPELKPIIDPALFFFLTLYSVPRLILIR